jgi:hypothetical protein
MKQKLQKTGFSTATSSPTLKLESTEYIRRRCGCQTINFAATRRPQFRAYPSVSRLDPTARARLTGVRIM